MKRGRLGGEAAIVSVQDEGRQQREGAGCP